MPEGGSVCDPCGTPMRVSADLFYVLLGRRFMLTSSTGISSIGLLVVGGLDVVAARASLPHRPVRQECVSAAAASERRLRTAAAVREVRRSCQYGQPQSTYSAPRGYSSRTERSRGKHTQMTFARVPI